MKKWILALFMALFAIVISLKKEPQINPQILGVSLPAVFNAMPKQALLSQREFSLAYRYPVKSVSEVFKDNILLNLAYLDGRVQSSEDIDWSEVQKPFKSQFTLKPGEVFAYHDKVYSEYKDKVVKTTNTRFNKQDGYKFSGLLYGDGVCQLASLLSWVAKDAGLTVKAPTNHDFAAIPEVPKAQGVSIFYDPFDTAHSNRSNLYITNDTDKDVSFVFEYQGTQLKISAVTSG